MKLKLGDTVQVLSGKDKGKKGKILKLFTNSSKVTVEKINLVTKHVKKSSTKAGERIKFEAPMNSSKTMLLCPKCGKATRVAYKKLENGKKQRICKKCGDTVDSIATSHKTSSKQKK